MAKVSLVDIKGSNGTVYVYEDEPYWDSEKQRGSHKRKLVGKRGDDGQIIWNKYYLEREAKETQAKEAKKREEKASYTETVLLGEKLILDKAVKETGLEKVLNKCFALETADKLLALSYFALCCGKANRHVQTWLEDRGMGELDLGSQRISDLFQDIKADNINKFFGEWINHNSIRKKETLLFDITSISSYGRDNAYVEYGYNRDKEEYRQINLALLCARESKNPLWYAQLPGSLSDKTVIDYTLGTLAALDVDKFAIIGDRGFYTERNLQLFEKQGFRFMMPLPDNIKDRQEYIDLCRSKPFTPDDMVYDKDEDLVYGRTYYCKKNDERGRRWFHVFYDSRRKSDEEKEFNRLLIKCRDELLNRNPDPKHEKIYSQYFTVKDTPRRGLSVSYNEEEIEKHRNNDSCYWVIITNFESDAKKALEIYRTRNNVELHFDDYKNLFDCKRLRTHSSATMRGKLFVNFLALILLTELKNEVNAIPKKDRKYMDLQLMLEGVLTYSKSRFSPSGKIVYSVPTAKQRLIFDLLKIPYHYKGKLVSPSPED